MAESTNPDEVPPAPSTAPSMEQAMRRLRIDEDLQEDVQDAIPQAKAEAEAFLDGKLYADAQAREDAQDARGIVCTPDIIAAQLLLIDAIVHSNTDEGAEVKRTRAFGMLRRHRNQGV